MTTQQINHSNSRFFIVWAGQLLSVIGNGLTAFALGVYVFHLTGSASKYSMVLLAAFLPALLLKPLGGVLADRLDRKFLMILGDAGAAFGVAFIIYMLYIGVSDLWIIYTGAVISSIFVAIQNPSYKASVTDLVSKDFYSKASGLMQLAESSQYIISPIIAGVLITHLNIKFVLLIDCFTFLIAILSVFWVRKTASQPVKIEKETRFLEDLLEGFKYTFSHKSLLCLLLIVSLISFFIGILQALLGPMILVFTTPSIFGSVQTIAAIGMLVSSVVIGGFSKSEKKIPILAFGLFFVGIFFSLIGVTQNIIMITAAAFMFFLALPFVNTSLDVLIRKNVDNAMQGRIWSIVSLISQLGMGIAFGIAGFLADSIFNPMLKPEGLLASSIGQFIGVGPGRGIALMFVISGALIAVIAIIVGRLRILKELDGSDSVNKINVALE